MPLSFHQDTTERVITYGIGITAMTLPELMHETTNLFTCLAAIGGFILVCLRIRFEWKNRK